MVRKGSVRVYVVAVSATERDDGKGQEKTGGGFAEMNGQLWGYLRRMKKKKRRKRRRWWKY